MGNALSSCLSLVQPIDTTIDANMPPTPAHNDTREEFPSDEHTGTDTNKVPNSLPKPILKRGIKIIDGRAYRLTYFEIDEPLEGRINYMTFLNHWYSALLSVTDYVNFARDKEEKIFYITKLRRELKQLFNELSDLDINYTKESEDSITDTSCQEADTLSFPLKTASEE